MSVTLFKNTASQRVRVYAYTPADGKPKTGDAAQLTAYVAKDYGAVTVLTDTTATEEDATNAPGYYWFDISQTETNADNLMISGKSSTAGVYVLGAPAIIGTRPATGFLAPTTAGRTLDVSATGEAGVDWANVGSPTTAVALTGTTIASTQKVDIETIKTNPVVNAGTVTFPTTATLASTTNITAGTVTTVSGNVNGSVGSVTGAVGSVTGNVGGNVAGSVASVTARVTANVDQLGGVAQSLTDLKDFADTGYNPLTHYIAGIEGTLNQFDDLNNVSTAQVNAEVVDGLSVDTYAEPGQEAPGATVSLAKKIGYIYKFLRNKITQTSTTLSVYDDAGTTVDQKSTVSDDGTTYTRGEIGTGP